MRRAAPHLQLVPAPPAEAPAIVGDGEQLGLFSEAAPVAFLGLVDVSRLTDTQFVAMVERYRPRYVFDARVAPYLNIGRLYRRDVFELFASVGTTYLYALPQTHDPARDPGLDVSDLLLREWLTERGVQGVALVFLQEAAPIRELWQTIRQQLAARSRHPPSIHLLNLG